MIKKIVEEIKSAGGYIRVSTQEQSQKGLSLDTQKAEIEEYCKRNGYKLTKLYIDRGITARKNLYKREAFMEMMEDVKSGKINHIVILRLDRFFRNVYDYHRMMNEYLIPNNCEWSAVKEDYTTTTTNGRLMINLRLSIAEQECDQDSDRIKDIFDRRAAEGYFIGGGMSYGLKQENKRLVPAENAHIVTDVFDTFAMNNSVKKTMNEINAKYNVELTYWIVRRILSNRLYIGEYRGFQNYAPQLTTQETFDACQRGLKMNVRVRSNRRVYPFSGLLVCETCGRHLVGVSSCDKYDKRYYRCPSAYLDMTCSNTHGFSQCKLEKYLLANIENLLKDYIVTAEVKEKSAPVRIGNRRQIENKIKKLNELFINNMIDMDELKQKRAELEAQIIEDIEPPKTDLTAVKAFLNSGFKNIYADLDDSEKQTLWRSVIKEIRIDRKEIKSVIFL